MNMHGEDKGSFLANTVFGVLFFLFICLFSNQHEQPIGRAAQFKLISELSSEPADLDTTSKYTVLDVSLPVTAKTDYDPYSFRFRMIAENRTVHQRFLFLHKNAQLIQPLVRFRTCLRFPATDTKDFPGLS